MKQRLRKLHTLKALIVFENLILYCICRRVECIRNIDLFRISFLKHPVLYNVIHVQLQHAYVYSHLKTSL